VTGGARWLIIVHPDELDLYHDLEDRFGDVPFVDVILDRRKGERRQGPVPMEPELRGGDRRRRPTPKEREQWALFGYRLVRCGAPPP
jgi:hypothetical protein